MAPQNNLLNHFLIVLVTLITFFVLIFVYTKVAGPIPFQITSTVTQKSEPFMVTGEGKVEAKPDSGVVSVGVIARAKTSEEAQNLLNTSINKVIGSIKQLGVPEESIKTENYNIYPEYGDVSGIRDAGNGNPNAITGYNASTNISINVNSSELANKVVDTAMANGANQTNGVNFEVKDKEAALNEARGKAVADAKAKAENAAKIAGFSLGKIINYSESEGGDYPRPMMAKAADSAGGSVPTQVQPGTNEIVVSVTLSYEIN